MSSYDHWIDTYEINPPINGSYTWGAKAKVKELNTGKINDYVTLKEHFGITEKEARSKAENELAIWILSRNIKI